MYDDKTIPEVDILDTEQRRFDFGLTYYLAGPMSGYPEYNFPTFVWFAEALRMSGIKIAAPHEIDHGETPETRGSLSYRTYMDAGLAMLETCQGIILLPGWPQSSGACAELSRSIDFGMPVYFAHHPEEWYQSNIQLVCMNRRPPS